MKIKTQRLSRRPTTAPARLDPEPETLRSVVRERVADRYGLTQAHAAVVVDLSGLGPRTGEGRR